MNKPTLKDRRRQEARDALYRAQLRRDQIIDMLMRNTDRVKRLRRTLTRLEGTPANKVPVSVAEGRLLEPVDLVIAGRLNDDISDLTGLP